MRKQGEESTAAESARRATGAAAERDRRGRFSARRKRATVLRLLRGEDLESVSRELGITAARASQWRDQFLAAGQAGLKSRAPDARDEEHQRLHAPTDTCGPPQSSFNSSIDSGLGSTPCGCSPCGTPQDERDGRGLREPAADEFGGTLVWFPQGGTYGAR